MAGIVYGVKGNTAGVGASCPIPVGRCRELYEMLTELPDDAWRIDNRPFLKTKTNRGLSLYFGLVSPKATITDLLLSLL